MDRRSPLSPVSSIQAPEKTLFSVLAGIFILATSCASLQKTAPPSRAVVSIKAAPKSLAPMPILMERIQTLEDRVKKKGMTEDDERIAKKILTTYRELQKASSKALTSEDQEKLIRKLFYSLMSVEERFFERNPDNPNHPTPRKTTWYIREVQFPLPGGKVRNPQNVARTGPIPPMDGKIYQTTAAPAADSAKKNGGGNRAETTVDFNLLLRKVNTLVQSRKYKEADRLLSRAEANTAAGPAREIILRAREQIHAEKKSPPLHDDINAGDTRELEKITKNLLEQEKFEEAIRRLQRVEKNSRKPDEKQLARLKESAETGLINRERNRAARIFLKARRITDPALRREKLSQSRDILSDLILNYPDSPLRPTLAQNLRVVEQALRALTESP